MSDAVVGYMHSAACANVDKRRQTFAILGVLADTLGMLRPLRSVTCAEMSEAIESLWAAAGTEAVLAKRAVVTAWLTWCHGVAGWITPHMSALVDPDEFAGPKHPSAK